MNQTDFVVSSKTGIAINILFKFSVSVVGTCCYVSTILSGHCRIIIIFLNIFYYYYF